MDTSFLSSCTSGGCGAKIGPGELAGILSALPAANSPNLVVGYNTSDDAAVYELDGGQSIVSTADFFSPMVEDPHLFGRIAAANALSDVWAMGGRPILALNLVCFPEGMDIEILGRILAGGAEKIAEAGAALGGGHSIYDKEPKYGLAVTGIVPTGKAIRNSTPATGHKLILTKPLGIGIVMAAARVGLASAAAVQSATGSMQHLNKYAAEKMLQYPISACTDVTGFGLLAHALEMAGDAATLQLYPEALPVIPEAVAYANDFLLTAAGQRNRNFVGSKCSVDNLPFATQELLFDPQTSGGLLIAVHPAHAEELLAQIQQEDPAAAIVGEVLPRQNAAITFR